jgi:hypothetical protein
VGYKKTESPYIYERKEKMTWRHPLGAEVERGNPRQQGDKMEPRTRNSQMKTETQTPTAQGRRKERLSEGRLEGGDCHPLLYALHMSLAFVVVILTTIRRWLLSPFYRQGCRLQLRPVEPVGCKALETAKPTMLAGKAFQGGAGEISKPVLHQDG